MTTNLSFCEECGTVYVLGCRTTCIHDSCAVGDWRRPLKPLGDAPDAIAEERERCAKIADAERDSWQEAIAVEPRQVYGFAKMAADNIAKRIREGKQ